MEKNLFFKDGSIVAHFIELGPNFIHSLKPIAFLLYIERHLCDNLIFVFG